MTLALSACSSSAPPPDVPVARQCLDRNPGRNAYFGDLHVHTKYSLDASTQATRVGPHDAYRLALGERIPVQPYDADGNGLRSTQLVRPLDFAAVTDHSEFFGETEICTHPEYPGYTSSECQFYRAQPDQAFLAFNAQVAQRGTPGGPYGSQVPRLPYCGEGGADCLEAARTPWGELQRAAEAFYDRSAECRFTTFVGYEWTGSPESNNWHRNVLFKSETVPQLPISYFDAAHPEHLWFGLATTCRAEDGCESLTIPHNSNLSNGIMFQTTNPSGEPFDAEFARVKRANEPLAEIMQHKGQSECLNQGASAADELCGYEILPYNNLAGSRLQNSNPPLEGDFLRAALKQGLVLEQSLGENPFKYGFIGSSDTHIGAPGQVLEDRFPGHGGAGQPNRTMPAGLTDLIEYNPGGLAVLWAEQNTRESLYDAMRRREAYGTSGPRMVVRFFGGWDLPSDMCGSGNFVAHGYGLGVPMGGDLASPAPAGRKPRFAVSALRDPGAEGEAGLPLQRVQIVKGWVDANGDPQEQVFEVAGDANNGASVNETTCETAGAGFDALCTVWQDPAFDAAQPAFYYARIVQNPSCRWHAYQCAAAGATCPRPATPPGQSDPLAGCCASKYPKSVQERAWTSPIWYRPS
ncbi:MAG TPA: DUF3604 domain-containing protein [Verrucomicrobiae bacterium]|nr:DUF3604 domain-containing protein [Verrucomicrobiae bacterium]